MERTPVPAAIELLGVSKRYGDFQAVRPLDLTIPPGATYGLLGPNGAGKTTTIRMIMRIITTDTGEIRILGEPQSQRGLDRIGYLPEERGVYRRMKVRRLLSFFAELKGMSARAAKPLVGQWLERFELTEWSERKLQELSKGMQQKVQFIGAILHEPEIVILDEPFSGLDPINQRVLRDIIGELKRAGRTILFCTHIIEQAERICDHVCIIARGQKVADGPIAEVKQRHGAQYVGITLAEWSGVIVERLRGLPQVEQLNEHGTQLELRLRGNENPQALLQVLVRDGVALQQFEVREPSLEQVFIERVGAQAPDEEEPVHV